MYGANIFMVCILIKLSNILLRHLSSLNIRPVSNIVLLPCRTKLIELNSTQLRQGSNSTWFQNVALQQITKYEYTRIHLKLCRIVFFIFVFCFWQQPFYSTKLNSMSETKTCSVRGTQRGHSSKPLNVALLNVF